MFPSPGKFCTLVLAATFISCVMGSPVFAQQAGYRTVIADEFARQFLASQYFSRECATTGGVLTLPSSLSDSDINQQFFNFSGSHSSSWDPWASGLLQARAQLTFGAAWNEDSIRAPFAGLSPDRTQSTSFSGSFGEGFRWRRWAHTTAAFYMDIGLEYLQNRYAYNSDESRALAPVHERSTRNWFACAVTSLTEVGLCQSIPLKPGAWEEDEDVPVSPWLRFQTQFANVEQFGLYGRNSDQRRFVNTFIWTTKVELFLPLGKLQEKDAFVAPFFQFSEMHDDGNRSLTEDGHLYRAGLRAGFLNKSDLRNINSLYWVGTAYWGKGLTGWQVGMGLLF
jgi:hypothetical protein